MTIKQETTQTISKLIELIEFLEEDGVLTDDEGIEYCKLLDQLNTKINDHEAH